MADSADAPDWGARLPGATLGTELPATPVDGCTAVAAKLKLLPAAPALPRSGAAATSVDGAATSMGGLPRPPSDVPAEAAADVCTWSAVTGRSVRSKPAGCGDVGAPGTGFGGSTAAPLPGTRATSTALSV